MAAEDFQTAVNNSSNVPARFKNHDYTENELHTEFMDELLSGKYKTLEEAMKKFTEEKEKEFLGETEKQIISSENLHFVYYRDVRTNRIYTNESDVLEAKEDFASAAKEKGIKNPKNKLFFCIEKQELYLCTKDKLVAWADAKEHYEATEYFRSVSDKFEKEIIIQQSKDNGYYMLDPTGEKTRLSEEQWVFTQTKKGKELLKNWEYKAATDFATKTKPVAILTGKEFAKEDNVSLVDAVTDYYKKIYDGQISGSFAGTVILNRKGVKDSIGHGITREKAVAYAAVPQVIQNGFVYERQEKWKNRNYDTAVLIAPVSIAKNDYVMEIVLRKSTKTNNFYLHEVEIKNNLLELMMENPGQKKNDLKEGFKTTTQGASSNKSRLIIAQHLDKVKNCDIEFTENFEPTSSEVDKAMETLDERKKNTLTPKEFAEYLNKANKNKSMREVSESEAKLILDWNFPLDNRLEIRADGLYETNIKGNTYKKEPEWIIKNAVESMKNQIAENKLQQASVEPDAYSADEANLAALKEIEHEFVGKDQFLTNSGIKGTFISIDDGMLGLYTEIWLELPEGHPALSDKLWTSRIKECPRDRFDFSTYVDFKSDLSFDKMEEITIRDHDEGINESLEKPDTEYFGTVEKAEIIDAAKEQFYQEIEKSLAPFHTQMDFNEENIVVLNEALGGKLSIEPTKENIEILDNMLHSFESGGENLFMSKTDGYKKPKKIIVRKNEWMQDEEIENKPKTATERWENTYTIAYDLSGEEYGVFGTLDPEEFFSLALDSKFVKEKDVISGWLTEYQKNSYVEKINTFFKDTLEKLGRQPFENFDEIVKWDEVQYGKYDGAESEKEIIKKSAVAATATLLQEAINRDDTGLVPNDMKNEDYVESSLPKETARLVLYGAYNNLEDAIKGQLSRIKNNRELENYNAIWKTNFKTMDEFDEFRSLVPAGINSAAGAISGRIYERNTSAVEKLMDMYGAEKIDLSPDVLASIIRDADAINEPKISAAVLKNISEDTAKKIVELSPDTAGFLKGKTNGEKTMSEQKKERANEGIEPDTLADLINRKDFDTTIIIGPRAAEMLLKTADKMDYRFPVESEEFTLGDIRDALEEYSEKTGEAVFKTLADEIKNLVYDAQHLIWDIQDTTEDLAEKRADATREDPQNEYLHGDLDDLQEKIDDMSSELDEKYGLYNFGCAVEVYNNLYDASFKSLLEVYDYENELTEYKKTAELFRNTMKNFSDQYPVSYIGEDDGAAWGDFKKKNSGQVKELLQQMSSFTQGYKMNPDDKALEQAFTRKDLYNLVGFINDLEKYDRKDRIMNTWDLTDNPFTLLADYVYEWHDSDASAVLHDYERDLSKNFAGTGKNDLPENIRSRINSRMAEWRKNERANNEAELEAVMKIEENWFTGDMSEEATLYKKTAELFKSALQTLEEKYKVHSIDDDSGASWEKFEKDRPKQAKALLETFDKFVESYRKNPLDDELDKHFDYETKSRLVAFMHDMKEYGLGFKKDEWDLTDNPFTSMASMVYEWHDTDYSTLLGDYEKYLSKNYADTDAKKLPQSIKTQLNRIYTAWKEDANERTNDKTEADAIKRIEERWIDREEGMKIRVGRHAEGITLNPLEYLLDDNGDEILFDSEKEAREYLKGKGISEDDMEYLVFEETEKLPEKKRDPELENMNKTWNTNFGTLGEFERYQSLLTDGGGISQEPVNSICDHIDNENTDTIKELLDMRKRGDVKIDSEGIKKIMLYALTRDASNSFYAVFNNISEAEREDAMKENLQHSINEFWKDKVKEDLGYGYGRPQQFALDDILDEADKLGIEYKLPKELKNFNAEIRKGNLTIQEMDEVKPKPAVVYSTEEKNVARLGPHEGLCLAMLEQQKDGEPHISFEQANAILKYTSYEDFVIYKDKRGRLCVYDASEDFDGEGTVHDVSDIVGLAKDMFEKAYDLEYSCFDPKDAELLKPLFDYYIEKDKYPSKVYEDLEKYKSEDINLMSTEYAADIDRVKFFLDKKLGIITEEYYSRGKNGLEEFVRLKINVSDFEKIARRFANNRDMDVYSELEINNVECKYISAGDFEFSKTAKKFHEDAPLAEFSGFNDRKGMAKAFSDLLIETGVFVRGISDETEKDVEISQKNLALVDEYTADLDRVKFFVDNENKTVLQQYYNPDATSGGQIVEVLSTFDELKEAVKILSDRADFEHFDTELEGLAAPCELTDVYREDFAEKMRNFHDTEGDMEMSIYDDAWTRRECLNVLLQQCNLEKELESELVKLREINQTEKENLKKNITAGKDIGKIVLDHLLRSDDERIKGWIQQYIVETTMGNESQREDFENYLREAETIDPDNLSEEQIKELLQKNVEEQDAEWLRDRLADLSDLDRHGFEADRVAESLSEIIPDPEYLRVFINGINAKEGHILDANLIEKVQELNIKDVEKRIKENQNDKVKFKVNHEEKTIEHWYFDDEETVEIPSVTVMKNSFDDFAKAMKEGDPYATLDVLASLSQDVTTVKQSEPGYLNRLQEYEKEEGDCPEFIYRSGNADEMKLAIQRVAEIAGIRTPETDRALLDGYTEKIASFLGRNEDDVRKDIGDFIADRDWSESEGPKDHAVQYLAGELRLELGGQANDRDTNCDLLNEAEACAYEVLDMERFSKSGTLRHLRNYAEFKGIMDVDKGLVRFSMDAENEKITHIYHSGGSLVKVENSADDLAAVLKDDPQGLRFIRNLRKIGEITTVQKGTPEYDELEKVYESVPISDFRQSQEFLDDYDGAGKREYINNLAELTEIVALNLGDDANSDTKFTLERFAKKHLDPSEDAINREIFFVMKEKRMVRQMYFDPHGKDGGKIFVNDCSFAMLADEAVKAKKNGRKFSHALTDTWNGSLKNYCSKGSVDYILQKEVLEDKSILVDGDTGERLVADETMYRTSGQRRTEEVLENLLVRAEGVLNALAEEKGVDVPDGKTLPEIVQMAVEGDSDLFEIWKEKEYVSRARKYLAEKGTNEKICTADVQFSSENEIGITVYPNTDSGGFEDLMGMKMEDWQNSHGIDDDAFDDRIDCCMNPDGNRAIYRIPDGKGGYAEKNVTDKVFKSGSPYLSAIAKELAEKYIPGQKAMHDKTLSDIKEVLDKAYQRNQKDYSGMHNEWSIKKDGYVNFTLKHQGQPVFAVRDNDMYINEDKLRTLEVSAKSVLKTVRDVLYEKEDVMTPCCGMTETEYGPIADKNPEFGDVKTLLASELKARAVSATHSASLAGLDKKKFVQPRSRSDEDRREL